MIGETEFEHESYGMVSFSHRQGSSHLFHSALENHQHYITLSVKTCKLIRSDTGDRLYAPFDGDIVEVDLSASQFAELLTTMNGMGTACTIRRRNRKPVAPPPAIDSQPENLRKEFKMRAKSFLEGLASKSKAIEEVLKKPTINKADRSVISGVISGVVQEVSSNFPFFVEMYREATEKIMDAAKAEIEGFMVSAIRQAGLAALAAGKVEITPPQLPSVPASGEEKAT